ncbi:MAG TPA: hypothetical protein V6C86_02535 [Oculatellaceae cyanobacterium]
MSPKKLLVTSLLCLLGLMPVQARTLIGGVEHSESLAPVEQTLAPGQIFDMRNLPTQGDGPSRFFKIPSWLAGTWHKDSQTDFYRYSYVTKQTDITTRTAPARSDGTWGTQRTDDGQVWQYDATPFNSTVDSGSDFVVQLVRVSEPVAESEKVFVRRSLDTQIRVDKMTGRIKAVESGEQLTTYYPEQDGLVKRESSAKVFDANGNPLLLGKSFSYETRVAEFQPQDTYQGKDVRALFVQFINGLQKQQANANP